MKKKITVLSSLLTVVFCGCTTVQKISKLDAEAGRVNLVCIVEHKAVNETVLSVIEEGLTNHGVKYRVISGSYELKNKLWIPTFQRDQTAGCDAMLFYVANWTWDLATYMHFANIWMASPDLKKRLGSASYDSRASLNKYINARAKLLELTNALFEQYKNTESPKQVGAPLPPASAPVTVIAPTSTATQTVAPSAQTKPTDSPAGSLSQKLRELQSLKESGLITDADYQLKKKQLLDKY